MQDELDVAVDGFRELLVPEAFTRRFTGHEVHVVPRRARTAAAFDAWVVEVREHLRTYEYPAGGRPAQVVFIEDREGVRWRWDESPCCERSWFAGRLRREVGDLAEPWLLAVDLAPPEPSWEGPDPRTGEWTEWMEPRWLDTTGRLAWYAEARSTGVAAVLSGVILLRHDVATGRETTTDLDVDPGTGARGYEEILRGHPARRAHRLRGG